MTTLAHSIVPSESKPDQRLNYEEKIESRGRQTTLYQEFCFRSVYQTRSVEVMAKRPKSSLSLDTVNEAIVDALIEGKGIGQKIKRLRLKRSMGLAELGKEVGLSASFLSQLENGRVVPTLRNLSSIALVFKKELSYFFRDENDKVFRISRAKDRIRLVVGDFLLSDSMSVLVPDRQIVPCIADFLPGTEGAFHPQIFAGLELVYVINGPLTLSTEDRTELLHAEDSAWIDGGTSRRYQCHEDKPARALIVTFALQS
jgi:transcriptional regulator with XRE-family HTH domain